jgi:hypothetical protein
MRIFKLQTPVLALIFGIAAEGLAFLGAELYWIIGDSHSNALLDFCLQFYLWFHTLLFRYAIRFLLAHNVAHVVSAWLMILVAVFQWWLIFLAAIFIVRYFRRRHDPAA